MDADQWRRYARLSVAEGALATAMGTLVSGVFLTGFALALGASGLAIGILAALPPLASLAQLVGAGLMERGVRQKSLCIRSLSLARLLWLAVLFVPLTSAISERIQIPSLIVLVGVSSVFSSLGGVASLSWTREMVSTERRLGFLGIKHQFNMILALGLSIVGAGFVDWWNRNDPRAIGGFVCVLLAAVVCGLLGIPLLRRIDEPADRPRSIVPPRSVPSAARQPLKEQNFRNLVYFYISWNLAANLAAPFFAVFMLQKLGLPFWQIAALQAVFSISGLAANRVWTTLGKQFGTRPVVFLATLGDAFYPLCWLFLSPETTWLLPLLFMFGAFSTPLAVGAPTLVMRLAPDERASSYLATFNAVMGVVMAAGAIAGGYLAANIAVEPATLAGISLDGLKVVFLLSFVGRIGSLLLLRRVVEPEAASVATLLREVVAGLRDKKVALPSASPLVHAMHESNAVAQAEAIG